MANRLRILVIDDDPMFRNVIVSLLRKNYIISVASDGKSGFDKAQLHRPDLVIIDYQMPGWDGLRTLRAFRNDLRFQSVKTMMLTSDATKETVLAAIEAGADSYIIKTTFNKDDFLAKIEQHLSPTIVRAVNVKSSKTLPNAPQQSTGKPKPFSADQKPAIQLGNGKNSLNPVPSAPSGDPTANTSTSPDAGSVSRPINQAKETPLSPKNNETVSDNSYTEEEYDLAKEMEEFRKTLLTQKATDELIEAASTPVQVGPSEEEMLEDYIDEWE